MEKDFIDQLKTIPLTRRQYAQLSLEREYIHWRIARYHVQKKRRQCLRLQDPLLNVVSNYDLSRLEFGSLQFDAKVTTDDDYFKVGRFDDGLLCISRHDESVRIVRDIYRPESDYNRDYYCACCGAAFLQALIPAAIFMERCFIDDMLVSTEQMYDGMVYYCGGIAGGESFEFFNMLLQGPDRSW